MNYIEDLNSNLLTLENPLKGTELNLENPLKVTKLKLINLFERI